MNPRVTFLFFHYGKIPGYLSHAIEHVRLFNPDAEIQVITDGIKDTSKLDRFNILKFQIEEFDSEGLRQLKKNYRHISCFGEKFERFVLERWFVVESIRKASSDRIFVMQDSDVAVFGNVNKMVPMLPDCPIGMGGDNPHFTFIREGISDFLNFILETYDDPEVLAEARRLHQMRRNSANIYNLGEMEFIDLYMKKSSNMQNYNRDTRGGFVDSNIHRPETFDYLPLRRRDRKVVVWKQEEGLNIPHFRRGEVLSKAFLLHFQGPGKRVFFRFNGGGFLNSKPGLFLLNEIFQNKIIANLL
jgi:hypothetical protein